MLQRLRRRTSLLRIEIEAAVEQIRKQIQLLHVHIIHPLGIRDQPRLQVSSRFGEAEDANDIFCGQLVFLDAPEIQQVVEMEPGKLCLAEDLVAEFASAFHDGAEHLVVGSAGEEDLARI